MATAAQIREHYDSLAFIYRTFWGDHIHHGLFAEGNESPEDAQEKLLDYCAALLKLSGGEKVLDVGCGHGGTLMYLAERFDCEGIGISLSPKQAQIAREKAAQAGLAERVDFVLGDANTFQFPISAFDLLWLMESSEHFADKTNFILRAVPALRPRGRLLLAAWTGSMSSPRVQSVAQAFLCPKLWTAEQYRSAIESAGMEVQHCQNLSTKVLRTWEICQERAHAAGPAVRLLPRAAREFVEGIEVILDAYRTGDLTYTVLTAEKR
jgi:cyclopropane fatty-acyl-phospholipid synthase-like methyltransferase